MKYDDFEVNSIDLAFIKKKITHHLSEEKTYLINEIFIEYDKEYNLNTKYQDISFILEKNNQ